MPALGERLKGILDRERDRWFLWWPVLFGAGIAAYFVAPVEPALAPLLAAAALAVLLQVLARARGLWLLPAAAAAAVASGAAMAKFRTELVRAPVVAAADTRATVTGWLQLVEPRASGGQRLTIRVASVSGHVGDPPAVVRIVTRRGGETRLEPGHFVSVRAVLSPPPGPVLPGAFDFGRTAWYQRLGAVGFAIAPPEVVTASAPQPMSLRLLGAIEAARYSITRRITTALPGETGAIASALITGERGGISEETNNAYRMSGLFHVLSISGLHMVVMAGALYWLVRFVLAAIPALVLSFPARKVAAVTALIGAFAYLLMSGAAVATVRSYVMISIMFVAILFDRPAIALRNVALAAAAILIVAPESLLDPGFQMSFAAVTALVAVHEALRRRRENADRAGVGPTPWSAPVRMLREIVLSTLVASAAVAPFGIFHFHNTQTMALIANVLAIPVCNMLVMPAALAALIAMPVGLETWPLWAMGQGIEFMNAVAARVAAIPGAIWRVPDIPVAAFALVVGGGIWLALWQTAWRRAGFVPIVAGIALAPHQPRPDLIVGRSGEAVAFRQDNGLLGFVATRAATFDVTRWLEHDGDNRSAATARIETVSKCDRAACLATVSGHTLAVTFHPSALAEECRTASIIVAKFDLPGRCAREIAVIRSANRPTEPPSESEGGEASPGSRETGHAAANPPSHDASIPAAAPRAITGTDLTPATAPLTFSRSNLRDGQVVTVRFVDNRVIVTSTNDYRANRPWGAAVVSKPAQTLSGTAGRSAARAP